MEKKSSLPIKIYRNKIESRITIKIKVRYYPELVTPETMKLLGITKNKITKNENAVNVPLLEITEVVLIHGNVVNNSYQQNSRVCIHQSVIKYFT